MFRMFVIIVTVLLFNFVLFLYTIACRLCRDYVVMCYVMIMVLCVIA